MPRPIRAIVHLAHLAHNLSVARKHAGRAFVWAVIKANAYGHGIERGVIGFAAADGIALLDLAEAVRVREAGFTKPILILEGVFEVADLAVVRRYGLSITIHCAQQIALLKSERFDHPVDVYLKMNSGMNRLGFKPDAYRAAYEAVRALPQVGNITLMTHFSDSDIPGGTLAQRKVFDAATQGLPGPRALCNSAALLGVPEAVADAVRPGIMLYGGTPYLYKDKSAAQCGLKAGMSLTSEIIGIQDVQAGEHVGYGSRFKAQQAMRIGIVACGYADGYPRHAPDGTPMLVEGVRTGIAGRVSMDMITVDLSHIPQARIGSAVELWGNHLPIDEVANAAGTIGYELMCAVAPRVPVVEQSIESHF
jgi:alanine racemase